MKRGHSNVKVEQTTEWRTFDPECAPGVARIPISGGASVTSCREFPPLALRENEWREIGRKMGWTMI